jgi:predicted nucleic acid-binding protein
LDEIVAVGYVPLTTDTMRLAAEFWANSRSEGRLRGPEERLDIDVILAAQARQAGGHVVTTNERHFKDLVDVFYCRPYRQPVETPE